MPLPSRRLLLVAVILMFTGRYVSWRLERFPFDSFFTSAAGWWMAWLPDTSQP